MNAKKCLIILAGALILLTVLCGCANGEAGTVLTESAIAADLSYSEYLPVRNLYVSEVEIFRRRTDKQAGTDLVYVTASGKAGESGFRMSYILEYLYYDIGGWILENVTPYEEEEWTMDPVSDSTVQQDIAFNDKYVLYDVTVTECSLVHENTDAARARCDKTMWIQAQGKGYHCSVMVTAEYEMMSDGWHYIQHYYDDLSVYPEYSMDTAEAERYVEQQYKYPAMETTVEMYWDLGTEIHYVLSQEEHEYLTIASTIRVDCTFDPYMLTWIITDSEKVGEQYFWDVAGTWTAEGRVTDSLYEKGFDYRVKLVITEASDYMFRVDYDYLNPIVPWTTRAGEKQNEVGQGTIYVSISDTYLRTKLGIYDITPEWRLVTDLPDTNDQLLFHADEGVTITHFSWGSYAKELTRNQ